MAKKLLFILTIAFSLTAYQSYSQRIMGEAILGFNMSKIEGDMINNGSLKFQKPGLNVGVGAILPLSDYFSLNVQTLFSQKGAYKKIGINADSAQPYYRTRLDYAEVPILFRYHDKNGLLIGTGFSYSRLVRAEWTVNGRVISNSISDDLFTRDNVDWIFDLQYRIWKSINLNVRYQYGLTNLWSGEDSELLTNLGGETQNSQQNHSLLSFRLIWVFGGEQSKNVREGID